MDYLLEVQTMGGEEIKGRKVWWCLSGAALGTVVAKNRSRRSGIIYELLCYIGSVGVSLHVEAIVSTRWYWCLYTLRRYSLHVDTSIVCIFRWWKVRRKNKQCAHHRKMKLAECVVKVRKGVKITIVDFMIVGRVWSWNTMRWGVFKRWRTRCRYGWKRRQASCIFKSSHFNALMLEEWWKSRGYLGLHCNNITFAHNLSK